MSVHNLCENAPHAETIQNYKSRQSLKDIKPGHSLPFSWPNPKTSVVGSCWKGAKVSSGQGAVSQVIFGNNQPFYGLPNSEYSMINVLLP